MTVTFVNKDLNSMRFTYDPQAQEIRVKIPLHDISEGCRSTVTAMTGALMDYFNNNPVGHTLRGIIDWDDISHEASISLFTNAQMGSGHKKATLIAFYSMDRGLQVAVGSGNESNSR